MAKDQRKRIIIYCILFIGLVIGLTALLFPYFEELSKPDNQIAIENWVNEMGFIGFLVLLVGQIIQVVIAFIPGGPMEIIAGALYGTTGGLALCVAGSIIGTMIIFAIAKRFGKKLLYRLFKEENVQNWKWLHDSKKSELVTFILFLIPGTPKDMLTYFVGVTDMSVTKFIIITTIARTPSIIFSAMMGSNMRQGDWKTTLLTFLIIGFAGIIGISFKDRIISFCRRE